jgi:hypothetical protein
MRRGVLEVKGVYPERKRVMKFLHFLNLEDRLVIGSMVLTMSGIILGAILAEPRLYGITTLVVISLLIGGWYTTRSTRLCWLLLFGLVAGVLELWSDWLHVERLSTLVYTDYFGFRILASPSYMFIGWWSTCVQFGYLTLRISERWSRWVTVGLITLLGMSLPPWYEEFAAPAKAWYYTTTRLMLSHTPVWIIFTYGGCMFGIATASLLCYRPRGWGRAIVGGFFAGAWFMFSGVFWYTLLQ